jgi:PhoPQ-activated pathogenicity-related protein
MNRRVLSKSHYRELAASLLLAVCIAAWSGMAAATPLDDYVAAPDSAYSYGPQPAKIVEDAAYTAKTWLMKSQTWLTPAEVTPNVWEHWVIIIEPKEVKYDKALMFIGGGDNGGGAPGPEEAMVQIAVMSKSIVAEVRMIPNQPLKFPDEKDPRYLEKGRTEDEFIAYVWDKFMLTGDAKWPARLPMTKAVVRAMDTVQTEFPNVKRFLVAGGSKRGWTTWTTAAVDPRVVAIAPAVIDVLNVEHSMQYHHDVYGYWAKAIGDYNDMNVMSRIHTPQFRALMKIVDPYWYIDRLTMPKYVMAATGDQFFLPDSSHFYFDALKGEKYLRYVPNTDHGLALEAYLNLLAFHSTVLENQPRPKFSWTKEPNGSLRVQTETPPAAVRLWQATNPNERNFRRDTIGEAWAESPLTDQGNGVYVAEVAPPPKGWTAFMVELEYPSGGPFPLKFTTEVSVVPQVVPYRNPGGSGSIRMVGAGKDAITLLEVAGDRYQMGYWYGRLLADQISRAWKGLSADTGLTEQQYTDAIDALWNNNCFDTMAWECELRGMADGCFDAGHSEITYRLMQKMIALPDMSENGCSLFSAWGKATVNGDLYQTRNLDWSMTTGLQNCPVVTIYNPTDGKRHALIGFAGLIGAAVGGMNENGLAVSEIMGHFGDAETLKGIPFPVLLRDVLYHDTTLAQALERMQKATRTNQYHYAIADPAAPDPKARLLFTSNTRFDQFTDDQVCTKHPVVDPTPFYEKLDDVLYWKNHNGSGNQVIYDAIKARYGSIDADKAIEIATAAGVDGTLVSIVYHNTAREFFVAFAEGDQPAQKQKYVRFSINHK